MWKLKKQKKMIFFTITLFILITNLFTYPTLYWYSSLSASTCQVIVVHFVRMLTIQSDIVRVRYRTNVLLVLLLTTLRVLNHWDWVVTKTWMIWRQPSAHPFPSGLKRPSQHHNYACSLHLIAYGPRHHRHQHQSYAIPEPRIFRLSWTNCSECTLK